MAVTACGGPTPREVVAAEAYVDTAFVDDNQWEVLMAKDKILAVAFTDLNGNDKYNAGKDELIAALVDTDGSGSATIGDTITFGTFPRLDGQQAGTFLAADATVTNVISA